MERFGTRVRGLRVSVLKEWGAGDHEWFVRDMLCCFTVGS